METGSIRAKRLSKAHPSVLQAAWHRHRDRDRRRRSEAPGVQSKSVRDSREISVRWEAHDRRLESELRGEDALDAEVRHSASVHPHTWLLLLRPVSCERPAESSFKVTRGAASNSWRLFNMLMTAWSQTSWTLWLFELKVKTVHFTGITLMCSFHLIQLLILFKRLHHHWAEVRVGLLRRYSFKTLILLDSWFLPIKSFRHSF